MKTVVLIWLLFPRYFVYQQVNFVYFTVTPRIGSLVNAHRSVDQTDFLSNIKKISVFWPCHFWLSKYDKNITLKVGILEVYLNYKTARQKVSKVIISLCVPFETSMDFCAYFYEQNRMKFRKLNVLSIYWIEVFCYKNCVSNFFIAIWIVESFQWWELLIFPNSWTFHSSVNFIWHHQLQKLTTVLFLYLQQIRGIWYCTPLTSLLSFLINHGWYL